MTNEETAAAILALPEKYAVLVDNVITGFATDLTTDDLIALAESWQQQNAMLEAADAIQLRGIGIIVKGVGDTWGQRDGALSMTHLGSTALEAYNVLKEKTNAG